MTETPPRGRRKFVRVKTAKGRRASSTRWLQRQLNDPYVAEAQKQGYRGRAAFKLLQLHEKLDLFRSGQTVVDLGAAPGGWCQVAAKFVKPEQDGHVIGLDLLEMEPIPHVTVIQKDFYDDDAPDVIIAALGGRKADIVMSDMAAAAMGHKRTDHLRIIALAETAYHFAKDILAPNGVFLAKFLQGGAQGDLQKALQKDFKTIRNIKPDASRKDSAEMYIVAQGFRGQ